MKSIVNQKLVKVIIRKRDKEKRRYRKRKIKVKKIILRKCIKTLEKNFVVYFHEFKIVREILLKILQDLKEENEICYTIGNIDNLEFVNINLTSQFACTDDSQIVCESASKL